MELTKLQEIHLLVFFITSFTDEVTPSINSYGFIILIISFISSFETNKANPFPALTAPLQLFFWSNLFIAFDVKLLTNPGKLSLARGIATFASAFSLN